MRTSLLLAIPVSLLILAGCDPSVNSPSVTFLASPHSAQWTTTRSNGNSDTTSAFPLAWTDGKRVLIYNNPYFESNSIANVGRYTQSASDSTLVRHKYNGAYYRSIDGIVEVVSFDTLNHEFSARLDLTLVKEDASTPDTIKVLGEFNRIDLISEVQVQRSNMELAIMDSTGLHIRDELPTGANCISDVAWVTLTIDILRPGLGVFPPSESSRWKRTWHHVAVRCPQKPDIVTLPAPQNRLTISFFDPQRRLLSGSVELGSEVVQLKNVTWQVRR